MRNLKRRSRKGHQKNNSAVAGRLHLKLEPFERAKLDKISLLDNRSLNYIGCYAIRLFLHLYEKSGCQMPSVDGFNPLHNKRPGRQRKYHEVER